MKNLIRSIDSRKPVVVWNPHRDNGGLTKREFVNLVKLRGYNRILNEGNHIIAYQPTIKKFGYETLELDLKLATLRGLHVYAEFLKDELEQVKVKTSAI